MNLDIIENARYYCKNIIQSSRCKNLQFHNWQHTKDVVNSSKLIAINEGLPTTTIEEIILSSYFHDLGNDKGSLNHEKRSCEYAQEFLTKKGYLVQGITNIINNIAVTEMPQNPQTISQKVICDADLAHLGKENFLKKNNQLRAEWKEHNQVTFSNEQWKSMNLNFLQKHEYHTDFARKQYGQQKLININIFLKDSY